MKIKHLQKLFLILLLTSVASRANSGAPNAPSGHGSELQIASSLEKAGMRYGALHYYERILSQGRSHPQYIEVLKSLAQMISSSSGNLMISQLIHRVFDENPTALKHLDDSLLDKVNFVLAKRLMRIGDKDKAKELAQSIGKNSPFFPKAQYLLGLAAVHEGNVKKGTSYFESVRSAIPESTQDPHLFDLRNLATLGIARAYYEKGYGLEEGEDDREKYIQKSLTTYEKIPRFSKAWEHAIFEMAWAHSILGNYPAALGAVHSLKHPHFSQSYYPELEIISAIVYWNNCRWDKAHRSVRKWNLQFEPIIKDLKVALKQIQGRNAWNDMAKVPQYVVKGIKNEPQYQMFSTLIDAISSEKTKLKDNVKFGVQTIRELSEYYDNALKELSDSAKSWVDRELQAKAASLEDIRTRNSIISLETKSAETKWLEMGRKVTGIKREKPARPYIPDEREQFWWGSNPESWKDELGYYRLTIKSECYE